MARFYGTIQGQRGEATRLGHSALHVTAQSYDGDVVVHFDHVHSGDDVVHIYAREHGGGSKTAHMFSGKIVDLLKFNINALVHQHAMDVLARNAGVLPDCRNSDAAGMLPRR